VKREEAGRGADALGVSRICPTLGTGTGGMRGRVGKGARRGLGGRFYMPYSVFPFALSVAPTRLTRRKRRGWPCCPIP
jgi:hypothetical protein